MRVMWVAAVMAVAEDVVGDLDESINSCTSALLLYM